MAEFRAELSKYDLTAVLLLCSYLNLIFEWLQFQKDGGYYNRLVASSFQPLWAGQFLSMGRPPFHRRQFLFVAKEALLHCPQKGIDPRQQDYLGDFGRVLLMANDVLYNDLPAETLEEGRSKVLLNFIPLVEYFTSPFKDSIVRSYRMTDEINAISANPGKVDIVTKFREGVGFDVSLFRAFCSGVLTRYVNSTHQKKFIRSNGQIDWIACCQAMMFDNTWFGSAINLDVLKKCLGQTASTPEELRENTSKSFGNEDFTLFRNRPIIRNGDAFFVLDLGFLVDKIETGPFWFVHSGLPSSLKFQSLSTWGDIVERYVNWLISASADRKLNHAFANPLFSGTTDEVADTAILCGKNLVLIECKGGFFNAKAKYSGIASELLAEIQKKLVENEQGSPKGIQQLANSIDRAFGVGSSATIDNLNTADINSIFPVLLVRDDIGAGPVINAQLAQQFVSLIQGKQYRVNIKPLVVVSLKAFEYMCRYLDAVSLTEILSARIAAEPSLYMPFWLVPNAVLEQIGDKDNSFVNQEFWKIIVQIKEILFPGTPQPIPPI